MRTLLLVALAVLASARPAPAQDRCPGGGVPPCPQPTPQHLASPPPPGSPQRPYTIVAEFDGTAPAGVRAAAKNLVVSALEESAVIAALPDDQVRLGLTLAGKPDTTRVDVTTARELAVRGSVRTVITGTIDQVGQTYHAAVRVLDADSNAVVATRRDIARGEDDLIPTLDRVVRALRVRLGEQRTAIAAEPSASSPLQRAATPSFAAFQHYRRGRELTMRGDYAAAIPAYKDALALDPHFAAAWRALCANYSNMGFRDSALAAIEQALAQPGRLTDAQRLVAEGYRAGLRDDDVWTNVAFQEQFHQRFGGSPLNLSQMLVELGRDSEAVALFEDWERRAPFGLRPIEQGDLATYVLLLGRYDEARRRAASLSGDIGLWARMYVASWTADWPTADSLATSLLARTGVPRRRVDALMAQASAAAARGRVEEGLGLLGRCENCQMERLYLRVASGKGTGGAQMGPTPWPGTPFEQLIGAMWAVAAGDTVTGRRDLTDVRALPPEQRRRLDELATLVEAWLAAAGGHPAEVVGLLRPLAMRGTPTGPNVTQPVDWLLAEAYERLDRPDSVAMVLERLAAWQGASRVDGPTRGITHSFVHQRLVLLYARIGRPADARRHWQVFSTTFTSPDPEMRHFVDEARAALASADRRN